MDKILIDIINQVNEDIEEQVTVSLSISETTAITKTLIKVYNEFVKFEGNGMNFTKEMHQFLNSLSSAYDKLNDVI